ncbi:glycan biosynthesis hexose transferase WsfD [Leptospira paudalimensis]|uniref:Glycosyltransferase RgtA/B/C/D-like domain-containing protein n=1 Tax=Leptospira paudalimensis TaxID=2950024 RepID=A0ABT3MAR7_9LEPT|nr:hypothetical protein [Leptospira paudalimensis]MCW7505479.1 hypothetical protein [Leptospira paudalimensis]
MEKIFQSKLKTYLYDSILIFFLIKSIFFLISSPLKGYANNFDANRYTRCYAVFPVDNSLIEKAHSKPIKEYEYKGFFNNPLIEYDFDSCFVSTELIFQFPTFLYSSVLNEKFQLQSIGIVRILSIVIFLSLFHLKNRLSTFQKVQILILTFLISDPAVLLYFNTFYAEPSGIIFLTFLFIILSQLQISYNNKLNYFLFFFAILLFFTKKQYSPLAIVFIGVSIFYFIKRNKTKRKTQLTKYVSILIITLVSCVLLYKKSHYDDSFIKEINKTNTILGFVFKYSKPAQIQENFQLNKQCENYIGKNWFEGQFWNGHPCPEIMNIGYSKLILFLMKNPNLFFDLTNHALIETKGWINFEYPQTEEGKLGEDIFTLNHQIIALQSQYFTYLFYFPIFVFMLLLSPYVRKNFPAKHYLITILLLYLSFYATIFGDGTFELTKHLFVFYFIFLYFYCSLSFQILFVFLRETKYLFRKPF